MYKLLKASKYIYLYIYALSILRAVIARDDDGAKTDIVNDRTVGLHPEAERQWDNCRRTDQRDHRAKPSARRKSRYSVGYDRIRWHSNEDTLRIQHQRQYRAGKGSGNCRQNRIHGPEEQRHATDIAGLFVYWKQRKVHGQVYQNPYRVSGGCVASC